MKSATAELCRAHGESVCDWRNETGLPTPSCPSNSHFETCASACPNTCFDPYATDR